MARFNRDDDDKQESALERCRTYTVEYANSPRRGQQVEALRSLAVKRGLPLDHVVELADARRLNDLFDVETRSLKYKDGKLIDQRELRIAESRRNPRVLLAEMEARRPTGIDGRRALAAMLAKMPV
jgi:hypothetical protein